MINKFIYVFSEQAKDDMLKNGYKLINKVENSNSIMYVFDNSNDNFSENKFDYPFIATNILLF